MPPKEVGPQDTTPGGTDTTTSQIDAPKSSGSVVASQQVAVFDWRAAARSTEDSAALEPIDHALTFTGLGAQMRECADRIGRMP